MTEATAYARQLFLYGEGDNPPIRNLQKLSEKSGSAVRTLRDHVKGWRDEATNLAIRSEQSPFSIQLSDEVLMQHTKEIEFLAKQVKGMRAALRKMDRETGAYHTMLSSYQSALTKWEKSSGIVAHYDSASAAMKESARAHAREMAKLKSKETPKPVGTKIPRNTRFDID